MVDHFQVLRRRKMKMQRGVSNFAVFALMAAVVAMVATVLCVSPALADNLYGSIRGTVTDPTGATVPNVTVTAVNTNTGIATKVTTTGTGAFVFQDLQVGT